MSFNSRGVFHRLFRPLCQEPNHSQFPAKNFIMLPNAESQESNPLSGFWQQMLHVIQP
jgi:hypothetical protein